MFVINSLFKTVSAIFFCFPENKTFLFFLFFLKVSSYTKIFFFWPFARVWKTWHIFLPPGFLMYLQYWHWRFTSDSVFHRCGDWWRHRQPNRKLFPKEKGRERGGVEEGCFRQNFPDALLQNIFKGGNRINLNEKNALTLTKKWYKKFIKFF